MSTSTSSRIKKGIVRRGFIKPVERLHEGLAFDFRPMLPEEVFALDVECINRRQKDPKEYYRFLARALATRLHKWSEQEDDKPLAITGENVASLPISILDRLRAIVCLNEPTDEPPSASDQDKSDLASDASGDGFIEGLTKN